MTVVGTGWQAIITDLEAELQRLDPGGRWCERPFEKGGTLRADWTASDPDLYPAVEAALDRAETASETTCERCGAAGTLRTLPSRWVKTVCPACLARYPWPRPLR